MSDERGTNPGGVYPVGSSQPSAGSGLTQDPDEAPGGVAQGGAPRAAGGALTRTSDAGFGMQRPARFGTPQVPPPGMMINPDFQRWQQMTPTQREQMRMRFRANQFRPKGQRRPQNQ